MSSRQLEIAFTVLSWAIGLSALTGLLWLGSWAPLFLADTFAFLLPTTWVRGAATTPVRLLGAAASCGWLLWVSRASAQREAARRWRRVMGFRDDSLPTAKQQGAAMDTTAKTRRRRLPIVVALGALGAGGLVVAWWTGRGLAERTRERLELRWPALMTLPEGERALIVKAALACDLMHQSTHAAGSVEACVREGVGKIGRRVDELP